MPVGGKKLTVPAIVSPDISVDMILGNDFMECTDLIIDYTNRSVSLLDEKKAFKHQRLPIPRHNKPAIHRCGLTMSRRSAVIWCVCITAGITLIAGLSHVHCRFQPDLHHSAEKADPSVGIPIRLHAKWIPSKSANPRVTDVLLMYFDVPDVKNLTQVLPGRVVMGALARNDSVSVVESQDIVEMKRVKCPVRKMHRTRNGEPQ